MESYRFSKFYKLFFFIPLLFFILAGCAPPQAKVEWIWPLPPAPTKLKYIKTIRWNTDVMKDSLERQLMRIAAGTDITVGLRKPYGVAARNGKIYVTDKAWGALFVFDEKNQDFFVLGARGPGRLIRPLGVSVDSQDNVYVVDGEARRVVVFDKERNFVRAIGGAAFLDRPTSVAVDDKRGKVYVTDAGGFASERHRIAVFDLEGKPLFAIGGRGTQFLHLEQDRERLIKGNINFNYPNSLSVDKFGNIYVSDSGNFRVQIFTHDGRFLRAFGQVGNCLGCFSLPKGIAVSKDGFIFVVDARFANVQIFSNRGRLMLPWGSWGKGVAQFWLPAGIAIDEEEKIYVADQYNSRIQVFQFIGKDVKAQEEGTKEEGEAKQKPPAESEE